MDQTLITRIVEGALLASSQPLTLAQLQGLFSLDEPAPDGSLQAALEALQAQSEGRGVELVELASGWRFQVKADVHGWVSRLWTERQVKYTRATLETLALIAYRQPITRGEIEQVRGVATNSNIIKALEEREWIRVVGHRDIPGRPELLGTTKGFLDYFGLKRLDELPPLSELKDFGELDPQLRFDPDNGTVAAKAVPLSADAEAAAGDADADASGDAFDDAETVDSEDGDRDAGDDAEADIASDQPAAATGSGDDGNTHDVDAASVDGDADASDAADTDADADAHSGADTDTDRDDATADTAADDEDEDPTLSPAASDDAAVSTPDDAADAADANDPALAEDGDSTRST